MAKLPLDFMVCSLISSVSVLGWHCDGQEDYNSWNFWKLPLPDIEDELKRFTTAPIDLSKLTQHFFHQMNYYCLIILVNLISKVGTADSGILLTMILWQSPCKDLAAASSGTSPHKRCSNLQSYSSSCLCHWVLNQSFKHPLLNIHSIFQAPLLISGI